MNILEHIPTITNTIKELKTPLKEVEFSIINNQLFEKPFKHDLPVFDSQLFIDLNAESSFKINVFNSSDDFDEQENTILSKDHFYKSLISKKAIIEYIIEGSLKGNAETSASKYFSLEASGQQGLAINWCKVHENEKTTVETIANEISNLKEIFSECTKEAFWNSFDIHEGVGFALDGEFKGALKIDIVEVLSSILAPVFALTSTGKTLPFDAGASSEIGFSFSKKDNFQCFIHKHKEDRFHISINKQKKTSKGIGLSASIGVSLNTDAIEKVYQFIDTYIEKYLGGTIESAKEKVNENLGSNDVIEILQKIDFQEIPTVENIIDFLDDYQEKIDSAKEKVLLLLKLKLELGLEYSYRKSVSESSMLDAFVTTEILSKHITSILKLDISPVLEEDKIEINRFLSGKGLEINNTLSIGLKLGNWSVGRTVEHNEQFIDIKHGTDDIQREVIYGLEKSIFADLAGHREANFKLVLDVETPTPKSNLNYNNLNYSLSLQNTFIDEKVRGNNKEIDGIERLLFIAVVWGIIEEEEYQETLNAIINKIDGTEYYKIETLFHVPPSVMGDLFTVLGKNVSPEDFSQSLAVAVLPNDKVEKSKYMDNRKNFYAPLLLKKMELQSVQPLLNTSYYKKDNKTWTRKDRFIKANTIEKTFFDYYHAIISSFKGLYVDFEKNTPIPNELEGSQLDRAFDRVKQVFDKANSGKKNGYEQRWFGHLLYSCVEKHLPEKADQIEKSFVIKYKKDGEEEQTIIVG